ncbi:MAG: triose-phosphate isomerase [Parcubacteria group bacterium]|nr:triose-phosphate isomerase [Parcubacteria group bacterium]
MKKFIVSNWKNYPDSLAEAGDILDSVDEYLGSAGEKEFSLVFCPSFVFIEEVAKILKMSHFIHQAELGAQDIATNDTTSLTGEVSGPMLQKLGVRYVIVGHSERRWKIGESDEVVNQKLKAVLRNEMVPIVCIGEKERNEDYKNFLEEQTAKTFEGLSADEISRCLIAYEPVWAISSNPNSHPDTPESALESVNIIKHIHFASGYSLAAGRYLYGGSVTSANARDFLKNEGFDGVLVGGASVDKEEFIKILAIAAELN